MNRPLVTLALLSDDNTLIKGGLKYDDVDMYVSDALDDRLIPELTFRDAYLQWKDGREKDTSEITSIHLSRNSRNWDDVTIEITTKPPGKTPVRRFLSPDACHEIMDRFAQARGLLIAYRDRARLDRLEREANDRAQEQARSAN